MYINFVQGVWNLGGKTPVQAADQVLTQYTAEQHSYYIERLWQQPRVGNNRNILPGADAAQLGDHASWSVDIHPFALVAPMPAGVAYWRHIVYAYMLEATNLEVLFRRLVQEWVTGERLPFPTLPTSVWLRRKSVV